MSARRLLAALALTAYAASPLSAQTPAAPQSPAIPGLTRGTKVWVTDTQGREMSGELVGITAESVSVTSDVGPRKMLFADVATIEKKDSNMNGLFIGAGTAFVLGALSLAPEHTSGSKKAASLVFGTTVYGLVGMLVDAAFENREVVYYKPVPFSAVQPSNVTMAVAPDVGFGARRHVGVSGTISWK